MIEALIERNPREKPKNVCLDSCLRGIDADVPPNFEQMFKPYYFGGRQYFGTKSDIINLRAFLDDFSKEFSLDKCVVEKIMENPFLGQLTNQEGYLTCFWDTPSQLHHRDIMRFFFGEVAKTLENYRLEVEDKGVKLTKTPWVHHYGKMRDALKTASDNAELANIALTLALDELSEAKVSSSTSLGDVAKNILRSSQGYTLYSEDPENAKDLWRARIFKVKLESKITKDQGDRGIMPTSEEIFRNIQHFVGSLYGVDLRTNRIILPESHQIDVMDVSAHTDRVYKSNGQYRGSKRVPVELRVQYDSSQQGC